MVRQLRALKKGPGFLSFGAPTVSEKSRSETVRAGTVAVGPVHDVVCSVEAVGSATGDTSLVHSLLSESRSRIILLHIARPSPTPKPTLCSVLLVNPNVDIG